LEFERPAGVSALQGLKPIATLPGGNNGKLSAAARLQWQTWEKVQPQPYFKQVYFALQKVFLEQAHAQIDTRAPAAAGANARSIRTSR
jgi:hypothetical protein